MGNRYQVLLVLMLVVLATNLVVGQPVYEQSTNVTLSVPCTVDGAICGASATCKGTVISPSDDLIFNGENMTKVGAVFTLNLTSTDTSENGEYQFTVSCTQGGRSTVKNLVFFVTPNGEQVSTGKGILYGGMLFVLVVLFVLSLYGGTQTEGIVGRSAFWGTAYLLLVAISFLAWNLSIDYMTSAPFMGAMFRIIFLFLLYSAFPVVIILTFYTMWMMKKIDVIQNMVDKGMPIDEAYERTVRQGHANRRNW